MRCLASGRLRLAAAGLLGVVCTVAVGSACRSVSVEFGTLPAGPTAIPTVSAAAPVQQIAVSPEVTRLPTPAAIADAAPPAPVTATVASGLSFAPRGTTGTGSGTITNQQQRDSYPFDGQQGQLLEVRVKRTSGVTLLPRIQVVDPSGATEASIRFDQGPEVLLEPKLASTGEYMIVVSAFQGTGLYSVTWSLNRFGQLANDGQVNAELSDPVQKDRFQFQATQGQLLNARVQRTSGVSLQPWIELVDPSGVVERSANALGLGQTTLETKLASSGTYTLVVGGRNTGPYQVTLSIR